MKKGWVIAGAAALILVIWLGIRLSQLISILLWAMVISYLLLPLARRWERILSPPAAAAASLATAILVLACMGAFLVPALINQFKGFIAQLPGLMGWARDRLVALEGWAHSQLNLTLNLSGRWLGDGLGETIGEYLRTMPMPNTQALGNALLVPPFAYYFLRDREAIGQGVLYLIPGFWRGEVTRVMERIHRGLAGYLRGTLLVSLSVGVLTGAGLALVGIPYALVLGITMMLCNIIPYFGPFLGAVPIFLVAASSGGNQLIGALIVVVAVQQAENLVISPRVMGDSLEMHPLIVIAAVLAGGFLWGMGGMLLALPLAIALREWAGYLMDRVMLPRQG